MTPRQLAEEMQKVVNAFELADGLVVPSLDADILPMISAIPATLIAQADLLDKFWQVHRGKALNSCIANDRCDLCRAYDAMMEGEK